MSGVLVVDFDDSFIHNICEYIDKSGRTYQLVHYSLVNKELLDSFDYCLLGPGPGHCDEYENILEILQEYNKSKFIGICLGFQMIGRHLGMSLKKRPSPVHGESLDLPLVGKEFGLNNFKGQFYNSWFLEDSIVMLDKKIIEHDMVVYFKKDNYLGVQFHPESVGTLESLKFIERLFREFND